MNIIEMVGNLYVRKDAKWIMEIDEAEIQPFVIQHWLVMNDTIRVQTRWLDKYVFALPPRMWLSLAWSVIPKFNKQPFVKYIKMNDEEEEFAFILTKVRRHMKLSDNDYNAMKSRLIKSIKDNMGEWFKFYGVEKKYFKQYYISFDVMKVEDKPRKEKVSGLNAWGI
jgi:hypothetical protein